MKCPACNYKMEDKLLITKYNKIECQNCKNKLKVSIYYRIAYYFSIILGAILGELLINLLGIKDSNPNKFMISPLIIGLSVSFMIIFVQLIFPKKLVKDNDLT